MCNLGTFIENKIVGKLVDGIEIVCNEASDTIVITIDYREPNEFKKLSTIVDSIKNDFITIHYNEYIDEKYFKFVEGKLRYKRVLGLAMNMLY